MTELLTDHMVQMNLAAYINAGLPIVENPYFNGGYQGGQILGRVVSEHGVVLTPENCRPPANGNTQHVPLMPRVNT